MTDNSNAIIIIPKEEQWQEQDQALILLPHSRRDDENAALVYLASLGKSSRRTMRQSLDTIVNILAGDNQEYLVLCEEFDWAQLRFSHTNAIRSILAERYAVSTTNKYLSALRGVLKTAWRLNQMSSDDYMKAVDIKVVKGSTVLAGRDLSAGEIAVLISNCEKGTIASGPRDVAIIALMATWGLRRSEVCDLSLFDYTNGALLVRGKGNKQRLAYPTGGTERALSDWITLRGDEPGALFYPVNKFGKIITTEKEKDDFGKATGVMIPTRLRPQSIYDMLKRRAKKAGVAQFSPHDLRRTCVGDLLDVGVDIKTVADIVGHKNVNTTALYDRRGERAKQDAGGKLHIPYIRRGTQASTEI